MSDPFRERLDRYAEGAGAPTPDTAALIRSGRRKRVFRGVGIGVVAIIVVAALAIPLAALRDLGVGPTPPASDAVSSSGRVEGSSTILQTPEGPAELCLGGVLESLPPQCSGIPLVGWDWDAVEGEERASGTTWGSFHVVGTYDGGTFTIVEAGPPVTPSSEGPDFTAPCPEPAGGWVDADPSKASRDDFNAAMHAAEAEPDSSAVWIDYVVDPVGEETGPFIGVFGFTGDLERHERELRAVWGGPMCVFAQPTTFRELKRIQRELGDGSAVTGLETTWSSIDVTTNRVEVGAIVGSPEIERELAERYGEGTVVVFPALTPV